MGRQFSEGGLKTQHIIMGAPGVPVQQDLIIRLPGVYHVIENSCISHE